jgi:cobalt-zinc-cadmium efflux system outer membrane protein
MRRFDRDYVSRGIEERTGHSPAPAAAADFPPGVDLADGLSREEAVAAALWGNAEFSARMEELGIARADLLQAGLLRNPTLDVIFPVGRKDLELTAGLPLELLGQLFYRKKAASIDLEAKALRLIQAGIDLAARVKSAHAVLQYLALRSQRIGEIGRLLEESARLTRIRHQAGDVSAQAVRIAELELLGARQEEHVLAQERGVARERLNLLLGFEARRSDWQIAPSTETARAPETAPAVPPAPGAVPAPLPAPPEPPGAAELISYALERRPDARAADLEASAAGERIGLARASTLPVVSPLFDVREGVAGPGLSAEIPVFDFNQAGIARARAQERLAAKERLALRDLITAEVRQALEQVAGERRQVAFFRTEILPRAGEAARAAQRAFELGEESILVVIEASRKLAEAERELTRASLDLDQAEIELERSVGGRLPPAPSAGVGPERHQG